MTQEQAFAPANDVLKNAVGGISDIVHIPGRVNVDFGDVKTEAQRHDHHPHRRFDADHAQASPHTSLTSRM